MSTSGESPRCEEADEPRLPPEWQARPGYELVRAVAYAPPDRQQWIRRALNAHVSEIEFVRSLAEIADTDADLALVTHERLAAGPEEFRLEIARRWRDEPDPIWVIIDAPREARLTYQWTGADIAVDFGTSDLELSARIAALSRRARIERDRSPLTGLPGNRWLRRHISAILKDGQAIALVMADIDNFKQYNDCCGHLAGDALILLLAEVMREATEPSEAFLAHVGGDDFAVVCTPGEAERIAGCAEKAFARRCEDASVTVVSSSVRPEEAEQLRSAFQRLAALRAEARE
jgi:diguanylate cyclase (GGDEF)-like protein